MNDDNDMIESAMDGAEVQIQEQAEKSIAEEVAQEVLAADSRVSKDAPKEEAKESSKRDKSGKFTKAAKEADPVQEEQISGQDANDTNVGVESQEVQTNSLPLTETSTFWPAALKEAVSKGSKEDVVKHFQSYDQQRNEWAYSKEREAARGKAFEERFSQVFPEETRKHIFTNYGVKDPFEATERLLAWNEVIEKDPRSAILTLMQRNRISLDDLANEDFESDPGEDPRIAEAIAKAEAAEQRAIALEQQSQHSALTNEVNTFKNGVDEFGNTRAKFCETYAAQIDLEARKLEQMAKQNGYSPSLTQILDQAYKQVYKQISDFHGIKPGVKQAVSQEQVIANAKKASQAASKASGAPSSGSISQRSRLKGKTFDDRLEEAVDMSLDQHGF